MRDLREKWATEAKTEVYHHKIFYRRTIVYVKSGKRWRIAASRATKLSSNV